MGIRAEFEGRIRCGLLGLCHKEMENILDSNHRGQFLILVLPLSPSSSSLSQALSLSPRSVQAFLLQTVDGKHQDLKYISPETVCADEHWVG